MVRAKTERNKDDGSTQEEQALTEVLADKMLLDQERQKNWGPGTGGRGGKRRRKSKGFSKKESNTQTKLRQPETFHSDEVQGRCEENKGRGAGFGEQTMSLVLDILGLEAQRANCGNAL